MLRTERLEAQSEEAVVTIRRRLEEALKDAPGLIPRAKASLLTGGSPSRRYLQNLDSKGLGPRRIMIGGRCYYAKKDYIEWLVQRST